MRPERELDERIADWVDGRLQPRDRARLEAEFEVNRELRRRAEEYRESVVRLRRALAEPEAPVDLADRVLARLPGRARPRLVTLPLLASLAAAAATVALFFALDRLPPDAVDSLETARGPADEPVEQNEVAGFGDRPEESRELGGVAGPPATEPRRPEGRTAASADEERAQLPSALLEKAGEVADDFAGEPEIETWLRGVVGEAEGQEPVAADRVARANLDAGPSAVGGRPAATAPMVVINLPEGQDLDAGMASGSGGRAAGAAERELPARRSRSEGVPPGLRELKEQRLQEAIDLSQVPVSNALPAEVDEIDPREVPLLQSAVGFDSALYGRGFLVRGDRQQVASFLTRISDWGRANGGGVDVTRVAASVVQRAQAPARPDSPPAGTSRLARQVAEEIEILLLFQTGQRDR